MGVIRRGAPGGEPGRPHHGMLDCVAQRNGAIRQREPEAPAAQDRAAAEFGSIISDDSSMASNCAAGTVFSSLRRLSGQAASWVPLKNQLLPLSARIRP